MNPIDLAILAVVGISALLGLARGAVREIFGLAALVLGFVVALAQYSEGARLLAPWIADPLLAQAAAFFGIFVAAWIALALAGALLRHFMRLLALSWLDRLGGLAFGLARGLVLVALLAWSFMAFGIQPEQLVSSEISRNVLAGGEKLMGVFPQTFAARFEVGLRQAREQLARLESPGRARGRNGGNRAAPPPGSSDAF